MNKNFSFQTTSSVNPVQVKSCIWCRFLTSVWNDISFNSWMLYYLRQMF